MVRSTKAAWDRAAKEPKALREHLARLIAALEEMTKAEGEEALKAAGEAVQRVAEEAGDIADEFLGSARAAAAAADKGCSRLENMVRDRPLVALSLAAATGFLVATLVRR